jgi:hypothetical protein
MPKSVQNARTFAPIFMSEIPKMNLPRLILPTPPPPAVMMDGHTLIKADRSTLFLYDEANEELWSRIATGMQVHTFGQLLSIFTNRIMLG